jgi:hypothetical protein
MDTGKLVEEKNLPAGAKGTGSDYRTEAVKLVEMGRVSVETKGFYRGVEVAFTPRG